MKKLEADIVIVGTGASGLFAALHVPNDKKVLMLTKSDAENSDSFLAQGGICVLRDKNDFDSFMEDTMKAGHYENRKESVEIMINSSRDIINELIGYGVDFATKDGELDYTREGAHSKPRILFHEDITGKEITSTLLDVVRKLENVTIMEYVTMTDIIEKDNVCYGVLAKDANNNEMCIKAGYTIFACGGIGGLYDHSTNYPHLTGDAIAIAIQHGIKLENVDYVQIHPTTLYTKKRGRAFLISESVRGEGARLYGKDGNRFANEVLPRDIMTQKIREQMKKDDMPYVWMDMTVLGEEVIKNHLYRNDEYHQCHTSTSQHAQYLHRTQNHYIFLDHNQPSLIRLDALLQHLEFQSIQYLYMLDILFRYKCDKKHRLLHLVL